MLSVVSYRGRRPAEGVSHSFSSQGGTLGRAPSSTLVLRDADQFISRTHARIEYRGDQFFVCVLGKNPIELNGRMLAQGAEAKVEEGDEIVIGDYTLEARLIASESKPAPRASAPAIATPRHAAPIDEAIRPSTENVSAFGVSLFGGALPETAQPTAKRSSKATASNHVPVIHEPAPKMRVSKAKDTNSLLTDWDPFAPAEEDADGSASVLESKPAESASSAAENDTGLDITRALPAVVNENDILPLVSDAAEKPAPASIADLVSGQVPEGERAPVYNPEQAVRALLAAAGVPEIEARALRDPDLMKLVGEMLREAVDGLHRVLRARAATKREMRVDQTMMEAAGNNPLKFTPDATEALRYLLAPRGGTGFMPPVRAVREAFADLQAHNLAVMAGVRAALHAVFMRFDPKEIEKRLKTQGLLDKVLPLNRKARMWDLMTDLHAATIKEAQDDFERLFGESFAKAYQEQMRKLRATKRAGSDASS